MNAIKEVNCILRLVNSTIGKAAASLAPGRRAVAAGAALALLAGLGALPASAQDAAWQAVLDAAAKEGKAVIYTTGSPDQYKALAAAFEAKHPAIKFEWSRMTAGQMVPRLAQEAELKQGADVVVITDHSWPVLADEAGHLMALTSPETKKPEWQKWVTGGKYVALTFYPYAMAYNTELVKEPLKGYRDLIARPEIFGDNKLATMVPASNTLLGWVSFIDGLGALEGIGALKPTVYDSGTPAMQAIASGEQSASLYAAPDAIEVLKAKGAPVEWIKPEEGWTGALAVGSITSWAANPNAAQVAIDFLMSVEGQSILAANLYSPIPGIPGTLGSPDDISVNATVVEFARDPEKAKAMRERWEKLFR